MRKTLQKYWLSLAAVFLLAAIPTTVGAQNSFGTSGSVQLNNGVKTKTAQSTFKAGAASLGSRTEASTVITHSQSQQIIPINTIACSSSLGTTQNNYYRSFDLSADFDIQGDFEVTHAEFGVEEVTGDYNITINIYSSASFPANFPGGATLQGTADYTVTLADNEQVVSVPVTATIPAGSLMIYEISIEDGTSSLNALYLGSNDLGETDHGYISAEGCDITSPVTFTSLGYPEVHMVMNIVGEDQGGSTGTFPDPYCDFDFFVVEAISRVVFADIDNSSDPNSTEAHEDFIHIIGNLTAGETYSFAGEGNTGGPYVNTFTVWIDWNQDGEFDEATERYDIGAIENSTGSDGQQAVGDIEVPADALLGQTRMRVVKIFADDEDDFTFNSCDGDWFGQAEDYTVNISEGSTSGPFPDPYCEVAGNTSVEPITRVIFADIDNSSDPNGTESHEDFTSVVGNVTAGETYSFAGEGNTKGPFTNYFTVWIDWNQDGVFNENSERYNIGTIYNSTGTDGIQAVADIEVPADALEGETRMRVMKRFSNYPTNSCTSGSTFGQTEDYTIEVSGGDPGSPCEQVFYSDDQTVGVGFSSGNKVANDITVAADGSFVIESMSFDVVVINGAPASFELEIFEDNGSGGIGASTGIVHEFDSSNMSVVSNGTFAGYPQFTVTFDIPNIELTAGSEGARYWISIASDLSTTGDFTYWVSYDYSTNPDSYPSWQYNATDGWFEYSPGSPAEGIMTVEGTCSDGGDPDPGDGCEQVFYSASPSVGVGFSSGNKVANDITVAAEGSFTIDSMVLDVVTLGGTPSEFELEIFEDNGSGGIGTSTGVIHQFDSSNMSFVTNGTFAGYTVYKVTLDVPNIELTAGASDARYWISIASELSTTGDFTYWVSYDYIANPDSYASWQYNATDGWFLYEPGSPAEGIMTVSGICSSGGGTPTDCPVSYEGSYEDGLGDLSGNVILAADFPVNAGEQIDVEVVRVQIFGELTSIEISFYEDNGGQPGTQVFAPTSMTPASQNLIAYGGSGSPIYEYELDMSSHGISLDGGPSGALYWMGITTVGNGNYWGYSTEIHNGTNFWGSLDGYETWEDLSDYGFFEDGAFSINCDAIDPIDPQCIFDIAISVEPITRVVLADIDNSSSPVVDGSPALEDFTDIIGNMSQGATYDIALEGNTDGPFTNYFTVWVDWNQDGEWDSSEMYEIGSINNSTGTDGQQATGTVTVPADAVLGTTTMRIIKNFNTSPTNPCDVYNWGQGEDYTIDVNDNVGIDDQSTISFSFYPNPTSGIVNIEANRDITAVSVMNILGQEVLAAKQLDNGQVNLSSLATGTYMFRVTFEDGTIETFKVIKE